MNYWIFKISEHSRYPDIPGERYVFDNTHSIRVEASDEFIYLRKAGSQYGLVGAGHVSTVNSRPALRHERRTRQVKYIFTADLRGITWFPRPLDLSRRTKAGNRNRLSTGLPSDLNTIGWSRSMPRLERDLFVRLLDAALDFGFYGQIPSNQISEANWRVSDAWSLVKRRARMRAFRAVVLSRHNHTCLVCGTKLLSVLDAAHIRSYASDESQRANPANGVCLCSYCHRAFDGGDITILSDGVVRYRRGVRDGIALTHLASISRAKRRHWLSGVDERLLAERNATP